jgi:transcriptional regulator with GAF, ATPase, and Fis domain
LRSSGFIRKYAQEFKKDVRGLSRGALVALDAYDWPSNMRELENLGRDSQHRAVPHLRGPRPLVALGNVGCCVLNCSALRWS